MHTRKRLLPPATKELREFTSKEKEGEREREREWLLLKPSENEGSKAETVSSTGLLLPQML